MRSVKEQFRPLLTANTYSRLHCPPELEPVQDFSSNGFRATEELYKLGSKLAPTKTWAEFGVGNGNSSRQLCRLLDDRGVLFLFDSWRGIPDRWELGEDIAHGPGSWTFSKIHSHDDRLRFVDGWYKDTLPFRFPEQLGLINIDCDVYSSTRDVLYGCNEWIKNGTVIVFDELIGYKFYKDHEYRALNEWMRDTGKTIEWLGKERFATVGVVRNG